MQIRALTDLNLNGFAVPINRVAIVDDAIGAALVAIGQATDDKQSLDHALLMNPDVIDLTGALPLPKSYVTEEPAPEQPAAELATEQPAEEPAPAKPAKSK